MGKQKQTSLCTSSPHHVGHDGSSHMWINVYDFFFIYSYYTPKKEENTKCTLGPVS